ncbi:hypothetical protein N431DRAFT_437864 [Stipitochalara longipes BDJ]|nr:hypothetical protein N431DRAFT_437864 [Stipitochalara longipes BDJ]
MSDRTAKQNKRKREKDASSKPNKRVAIEVDEQINVSLLDSDEWAPVIALTPGLTVPSSIALDPYVKLRRNAPQRPGKSSEIATKELLLHSSEHPKLDYTAREEDSGGSDTLLKHYIGIYDPDTGKMEVMEARKMVVRGVVRAHQATAEDEAAVDYRDRRNDLGQTFGTKKAKKAIASVTENAIDPNKFFKDPSKASKPEKLTVANLAMLSSIAGSAGNAPTKEEQGKAMNGSKPRPKGVEGELDPLKIYTVENVVGLDTMKLIPVRKWVESMNAKKEVQTTSRFVARRMQTHVENPEKLKLLRYMLLLIDIYNASKPGRFGRGLPRREDLKKVLGDIPEAVLEGVKRKFTEAGIMNRQMSDSMIMYLCALAMMVDSAEVDIWDLKEDLKLETKEMSLYFTEIGAKIAPLGEAERKRMRLEKAAAAQHRVAKLRGPLKYPQVSQGRSRK